MKKFLTVLTAMLVFSAVGYSATVVYTNFVGQVVTVTDGIATVSVPAGTADTVAYGTYYSQNVTNGQEVTLVAGTVNLLAGTGSAASGTNTITLAPFAAADVGKVIWVFNASTATNLIAIAQTGNYGGPALELSAGEGTFMYVASTTNVLGK